MSTEELLQAGITAARAGDIAKATKLLVEVIKVAPNSDMAWVWLGICRAAPEQREYCFHRALDINPANAEARRQMSFLPKPLPHTPAPAPIPPSQPAPPFAPPPPPQPAQQPSTVSPFVEGSLDEDDVKEALELPMDEKPESIPLETPKLEKKNNRFRIWIGVAAVLLLCFAIAGVLFWGQVHGLAAIPGLAAPTSTASPTAVPSPTTQPAPAYTPVFESAPCDFAPITDVKTDCGYVIVPQDRNGDIHDTIRLALVIFRSTSPAPQPDPVIFLQGGPGGKAVEWAASSYQTVIAPLLKERDFIAFDPRGTGLSEPALECDEFLRTYLQDLQGKIPADKRQEYYQGALLACRDNLTRAGANLSMYDSAAMAADVKDVIQALGYQQADLYSVSYGTRVAQLVMQNYPEVVRSAILDSVVPVEAQMLNQNDTGQQYALNLLFDSCASDPACSSAYPNLKTDYASLLNSLNTLPIKVTITRPNTEDFAQVVDGDAFQQAVMWALRVPQTIPLAPRLIERTQAGDPSILTYILSIPLDSYGSISMGDYIAVNCRDQVFTTSSESLDNTIFGMCKLWQSEPPATGANQPVHSDIPTLIVTGLYDSATPPSFAHQLSQHLTHSYVVEIPDQGHAPTTTGFSDCPLQVMESFLNDPSIEPDTACVQETKAVQFLAPYTVDIPIKLETVNDSEMQVFTRVPSGWTNSGQGFYSRRNSLLDITQIAIQQAATDEAEWTVWLSTKFNGQVGLDQPPVKYDQRDANGMTWSLYKSSFHGNPVDIAFARSDSQTLMVLLLSYPDERDALYQNVFLPVIDATHSTR